MPRSVTHRPPLALIANVQEWSCRSIESILAPEGYAVLRAHSSKKAVELALNASPDVIILDHDFPDRPGIDVCRTLRADPRIHPATPIVITTASSTKRSDRLAALGAGAWDVLSLPLDAKEFLLRLNTYVRAKFVAEQSEAEGMVDDVTGLYNLRGLMRRMRELGSDAYRHERALACVALAPDLVSLGDLDEKESNGRLWALVDRFAEILKQHGRVSDAIGRLHLSEFVVIAPATDEDQALKLAERLSRLFQEKDDGEDARFQMSAGYDAVANFREAGVHAAALLAGATAALRESLSDRGASRIRRFSGDRDSAASPTADHRA